MAHHVGAGQARHGNAFDALEHPLGVDQAAQLRAWQVDLAHVAGHHGFAAKADARQKHLHLLGRGVLRLVQDHKCVVQRAPAHESQRRDFNLLALKGFLHPVKTHQLVQCVVERAQVRINLLRHVAGQKTQALARLDGRARQHDFLHRAALQRIDRAGHGQISLARARRADAKSDVVRGNVFQISALVERACAQVGAACGQLSRAVGGTQGRVACEHQLHGFRLNRALGDFVQRLQHFERLLRPGLEAVNLELLKAVCNRDLQPGLNRADVRIHRAA